MTRTIRETATWTVGEVSTMTGIPADLLRRLAAHGLAPEIQVHNGEAYMRLAEVSEWGSGFPFRDDRRGVVAGILARSQGTSQIRRWVCEARA